MDLEQGAAPESDPAGLTGRWWVCEGGGHSRGDIERDEGFFAWAGDDTGSQAPQTVLNGSVR